MRHATIIVASLTLLVTSLSVGCAGNHAAHKTDAPSASAASAGKRHKILLGRLEDPSYLFNCQQPEINTLTVKAMAYVGGCSPKRNKRNPRGAWGDLLTEDIKAVAVSPDLLEMGLDHGDVIRIEGLPGEYKVLDVMNARHNKSIDIYYGNDRCGAMEWGQRTLTISWQ